MKRPDKNTILNSMVSHAADIMEAKAEFNIIVAEQFEDTKGRTDTAIKQRAATAAKLRADNIRILAAVALIRENAGCWS